MKKCELTRLKPSIEEIRRLGQKPNFQTDGNWLARKWARPSAVYGTWLAIRMNVSPNQVTALAAISWLAESIAFARGTPENFCLGVLFGLLGFWLDHVDGQVARFTNRSSPEGIFLDFWMHSAHALARAFGLGWGCFVATGYVFYLLAGMLMAFGWSMLSLANDSKYKAVFAILQKHRGEMQLKTNITSEKVTIISVKTNLVEKVLKCNRYFILKLHEPHSVLMVLGVISLFRLSFPEAGKLVACLWILFWAITSPLLSILRLWRMIDRQEVNALLKEYFDEMI